MRLVSGFVAAVAVAALATSTIGAQGRAGAPPPPAAAQDEGPSKAVAGGGITVPGWTGKVDAGEEKAGLALKDAKLAPQGKDLHVTTGPATTYWNPANKATGDYTVSATFTEAEYMGLNDHPHPYGIVIAGNDLGTPTMSALYCSAYGNGTFIVRGFGPDAFSASARRPTANDAVHKAGAGSEGAGTPAAKGKPVTQEIAMSVKGDKVSCIINGTEVASFTKAELVAPGKLKSTDGVYGIRFAHNTDAIVTGLKITK
jgi:hypothetical protein